MYPASLDAAAAGPLSDIGSANPAHTPRAERYLAAIAEQSRDALFGLGLDGCIVLWTRAAAGLLGWGDREVLQRPIEAVFAQAECVLLRRLLARVARGEVIERYAMQRRHREGDSIWTCLSLYPVRDGRGTVVEAAAVERCITEQKLGEEALRASLERERHGADRLLRNMARQRELTYVVSHDLKGPLRAVATLACWLCEDLGEGLGEEPRRQLALLRSRVFRMDRMVDALLEFVALEEEAGAAVPVDCAELVRAVAAETVPAGRFEVRVAAGLPQLMAVPEHLRRVVGQLLDNAWRHHDRAGGCIVVDARPCSEGWEFRVADDGPGVPARYAERVLRIFQTLQPRDRVENTGMGLALVRRLVELNGGRVKLEPNRPRGTVVRFTWSGRAAGRSVAP